MSALRKAYFTEENTSPNLYSLPPTIEELDGAAEVIRRHTQPTTAENIVDHAKFYTKKGVDTMTDHVPSAAVIVATGAMAASGCASSSANHNTANVIPLSINPNQAASMIASPTHRMQTSQQEAEVLSILNKGQLESALQQGNSTASAKATASTAEVRVAEVHPLHKSEGHGVLNVRTAKFHLEETIVPKGSYLIREAREHNETLKQLIHDNSQYEDDPNFVLAGAELEVRVQEAGDHHNKGDANHATQGSGGAPVKAAPSPSGAAKPESPTTAGGATLEVTPTGPGATLTITPGKMAPNPANPPQAGSQPSVTAPTTKPKVIYSWGVAKQKINSSVSERVGYGMSKKARIIFQEDMAHASKVTGVNPNFLASFYYIENVRYHDSSNNADSAAGTPVTGNGIWRDLPEPLGRGAAWAAPNGYSATGGFQITNGTWDAHKPSWMNDTSDKYNLKDSAIVAGRILVSLLHSAGAWNIKHPTEGQARYAAYGYNHSSTYAQSALNTYNYLDRYPHAKFTVKHHYKKRIVETVTPPAPSAVPPDTLAAPLTPASTAGRVSHAIHGVAKYNSLTRAEIKKLTSRHVWGEYNHLAPYIRQKLIGKLIAKDVWRYNNAGYSNVGIAHTSGYNWHQNFYPDKNGNYKPTAVIDCSGLVNAVIADEAGVNIDQTTFTEFGSKLWKEIPASQVEPGDLVQPGSLGAVPGLHGGDHVEIVTAVHGNTLDTFGAHTSHTDHADQVGPDSYFNKLQSNVYLRYVGQVHNPKLILQEYNKLHPVRPKPLTVTTAPSPSANNQQPAAISHYPKPDQGATLAPALRLAGSQPGDHRSKEWNGGSRQIHLNGNNNKNHGLGWGSHRKYSI